MAIREEDFEKLGVFYLGRACDRDTLKATDELLLYDSRDLLTHAVCIGMTGSGKTGLCLSLVEEAAIDNIPVIAIDPKGDISNLLLTFPNLSPEEFQPWVSQDEARRQGVTAEVFAQKQAQTWKEGLAQWGETPERIKRLKENVEFAIYTPGSGAGRSVSIVKSLSAPPAVIIDDPDALRERVTTTATCILTLLSMDADPLRSREHILLSNILSAAWKEHRDLDLSQLIAQIQKPPFNNVGAIDLESFFPAKERFALAMGINNLLAAPGFDAWLSGEPLDVDSILYTASGKPRVSIFSIAHLSETERMFFVSLLLNQVLSWMRAQSGTTSLRAILYMDEIFGFFPPTANPPSKAPLLTLLKQARAFGLGVVLASQNPVDLDYKGLSNTGTWFIGRLQTERDKMRVLEGLEGAAAGANGLFDRGKMDKLLAGLRSRTFLLNNVHEGAPRVFETRWTLSYLRGPLTLPEIKRLMIRKKESVSSAGAETDRQAQSEPSGALSDPPELVSAPQASPSGAASSSAASSLSPADYSASHGQTSASPSSPYSNAGLTTMPPILPPDIRQYYLCTNNINCTPVLKGKIIASALVRFVDTKIGLDVTGQRTYLASVADDPIALDWDTAIRVKVDLKSLVSTPPGDAAFARPAPPMSLPANYKKWEKDFQSWLSANQNFRLLRSATLDVVSKPNESERDFRIRLGVLAKERRDELAQKLKQKYATKLTTLQDKVRTAEQRVERAEEDARDHDFQSAISIGSTIIGAFAGRKALSRSTLDRAGTAARRASRASNKHQDVERANETLGSLQDQLNALEAEFKDEMAKLDSKYDPTTEQLEVISVKPKKTAIDVQLIALLWLPYVKNSDGTLVEAWK